MNDSDEATLVCSDLRALRSRANATGRQTALALTQLHKAILERHLLLASRRQTGHAMQKAAIDTFRAVRSRLHLIAFKR